MLGANQCIFSSQKEEGSNSHFQKLNLLEIAELKARAEAGDPQAQYLYAGRLERQSQEKAIYWYIEASKKLREAQYMLGRLHERKKERDQAFEWYTRAAAIKKENNLPAQYKLLLFHEKGLGCEPSMEMMKFWCLIINRPSIATYMSFDEEYNKFTQ